MAPTQRATEQDPIYRDDGTGGPPKPLRKKNKFQRLVRAWEVRTSLLSWCIFTLTVCLLAFALEEFPALVWVLLTLCVMLSLLFVLLGITSSRNEHIATGLLCLASMGLAALIGLYVSEEFMRDYWHLKDGADYQNVLPSQKGSSHADASEISFVRDAFVDTQRTVGWMNGGSTWCVAPVAGGGAYSVAVEYWAVGENCCLSRSGFNCDDSADANAKKAWIPASLSEKSQEVENYREAIKQAEKVYAIKSQPGAILVRWLKDPGSLTSDLWTTAVTIVVLAIVLHLLGSVGTSVIIKRMAERSSRR
jgi:hypothetical protein